jgi:hypothetical protein
MAHLDRLEDFLVPDHSPEAGPQVTTAPGGLTNVSGTIATTPTHLDETIDVLVDHLDGSSTRIGPAYWSPKGTLFPVRGEKCLVSFDEKGDAWVPVWWTTRTSILETELGIQILDLGPHLNSGWECDQFLEARFIDSVGSLPRYPDGTFADLAAGIARDPSSGVCWMFGSIEFNPDGGGPTTNCTPADDASLPPAPSGYPGVWNRTELRYTTYYEGYNIVTLFNGNVVGYNTPRVTLPASNNPIPLAFCPFEWAMSLPAQIDWQNSSQPWGNMPCEGVPVSGGITGSFQRGFGQANVSCQLFFVTRTSSGPNQGGYFYFRDSPFSPQPKDLYGLDFSGLAGGGADPILNLDGITYMGDPNREVVPYAP